MEWMDRLNQAIQYIEEHITEEIDYEEVAKIAACSAYHFQRMFTYMADLPISEYIRRRRMSLAAVDLQQHSKVIDVAFKYGYESPTAFNRAFKSIHGIAPSQAKELKITLKAFPAISFQLTIKGVSNMDYRIEKREEIRIVGVSAPLEKDNEKNFEIVPTMWQAAIANRTLEQLAMMMDQEPKGILGVSTCNTAKDWRYYIAVATSMPTPVGMQEYVIPAMTWAIFTGTGTNQSIQELEKRIVTEWLPTSGYEYDNAPDIEVYYSAEPENAMYEVWIPVVKKNS